MTAHATGEVRDLASYRPKAVGPATTAATAIDQFVRGAALARAIYAVVGADGIAAVPSPTDPARGTYLFWSHQAEAERWADALVAAPRIVSIDLQGFLAETVPALRAMGAYAGLDWSAEPVEAQLEPEALGVQLRDELVHEFAATANRTRFVWALDDGDGIASVSGFDGGVVTPVWADRHTAEHCLAAINASGLHVARRALLDLTNRYLLSATGLKSRMAPAYIHADAPVLMSPWAFKALLNGGGRPTTTRMATAS